MHIIAVSGPGHREVAQLDVQHGQDPRQALWSSGYVVTSLLSARLVDDVVVITVRVSKRTQRSRPPKIRRRGIDQELALELGEEPVIRQRIAAYAIVQSSRGVLGTQCSRKVAVPGLWQLPGGGLDEGETPAAAVLREIREESAQEAEIDRLIDLQSDHWIGRAPTGVLEDFHALRVIYLAHCENPTDPQVLDVGGTTQEASWIPLNKWRGLPWASSARSALDRHLSLARRLPPVAESA